MANEDFQKYFDKVLNFLSYRSRSEYEINFYMLRKGWGEEIREEIIGNLKKLKLIDDEDFARQWIAHRSFGRPAGRALLKLELCRKGIAKEIVDRLLMEERASSSEEILAEKLCGKRLERLKNLSFMEQKNKLYGLLARRGFASEVVTKVVDKLVKRE